MDWMKIGSAMLLVMFLILIVPRIGEVWKNTPEAKPGDWPAALLAIGGVIVFVFLLMSAV